MSNKEDSYKIPSISSLQQEKSIKVKSKNDIFNIVLTKIIQKITNQFASHLKDENSNVDDSIEWIEKVFQIGLQTPQKKSSLIEEKYKINLS